MASIITPGLKDGSKPDLISIINGFEGDVYDAVFLAKENYILSSSDDRALRLWVMRDSGRYWPSVEKALPSPAVIILFDKHTNRVCTGLANGTISDFTLSADYNSINHTRDILAHVDRITGLLWIRELKVIFSTSKDQTTSWFSDENGQQLGSFNVEAAGTCLQFDVATNCLFIGDANGRITLLSFAKSRDLSSYEFIRQLHGHTKCVTSMCWDGVTSRLISSSADNSVILWDIGGGKGTAFELQGHRSTVTSTKWWHKPVLGNAVTNSGDNANSSRSVASNVATYVISTGLDGLVFFWLIDGESAHGRRVRRQETPNWTESDLCQLCSAPFFWNIKKMWTDMSVGVRQHHCRRCGKAVCEKCSLNRSVYPVMGFEREVRMCNECFKAISAEDLTSLAHYFDARHPIVRQHLLGDLNFMLTIGKNKEVKVWDLKSFL
ncbi:unnamed protein product [Hydatigera taeniaeformis]|uniref:FYVE-type domain-containing protein n=1 Tax=Hydatigena taeniaeformis TaxID=6205 RepID=A0A0R3X0A4_HYDTA|nr:unnamed protein product [Hydatigera taeniaeformis]